MSTVRKRDGEGTFAGSRGNDGVAPIAAVWEAAIELLDATLKTHSWPRLRMVGRPGSVPRFGFAVIDGFLAYDQKNFVALLTSFFLDSGLGGQ
jgi:hypothetical protein